MQQGHVLGLLEVSDRPVPAVRVSCDAPHRMARAHTCDQDNTSYELCAALQAATRKHLLAVFKLPVISCDMLGTRPWVFRRWIEDDLARV